MKIFVQDTYKNSNEWSIVLDLANQFHNWMNQTQIQNNFRAMNVPGKGSADIEKVITPFAQTLGFLSQKKHLFKNYSVSSLRPDYHIYFENLKTGIIIEVEKGQATQNNNTLKDFWKCHLCDEANYLFLFVPEILVQNVNKTKPDGYPYRETIQRFKPFFERRNYTNVRGVVIYGY